MRIVALLVFILGIVYGESSYSKKTEQDLNKSFYFLKTKQTEKAIKMYIEMDRKGVVEATVSLGLIYGFGVNGVQIDKKKAIEYFKKATLKNHPASFYYLALLMESEPNGKNIAKVLIMESAEAGFSEAQFAMGKMLLEMNKTKEAKYWLEESIRQGNKKATKLMKSLNKKNVKSDKINH